MGFLETIKNIGNGAIFNIAIPNPQGTLFTNSSYSSNQEPFIPSSQSILSNYTLVTQTGNSNFYVFIKEGETETEYSITTGAVAPSFISVKYDPSDEKPSFLYVSPNSPYFNLNYLKLSNGIWSGAVIGNLGPGALSDAIDLEYDPKDNLPACVLYDLQNYDLNYYKFNGSSFIKTTIVDGGSVLGAVSYASLNFDTSDNQPMINFIEGDSSILKSAKYDGTTWTITNVNTFSPSYSKRHIATEFSPTLNQPLVLINGGTTGIFMNVRDSSNIWKSGAFGNRETISRKPEFKISEQDQEVVYIAYLNNQRGLGFIEKDLVGLINTNWTADLDDYNPIKLNLVSGSNFIDDKPIALKIDSDLQPLVFYKKDNIIKYIKNTGALNNLSSASFSGEVNFKNINNSSSYNYDIEFFKDTFQVYQTFNNTLKEYKSPYKNVSNVNFDSAVVIYSSDMKINPITKQPNIVLFSNTTPQIRFSYPNNNQRSSWTTLKLPSGNLNFSGTNLSATLSANYNCNFDFDKVTNQAIISVFGFRSSSSGTAFIIKKDLEGSGYQYYNTPYTGYYSTASEFKVNPITNKYCLAIANDDPYSSGPVSERGLLYCEMDPNTNSWTKTKIEDRVAQNLKIYLEFKSNGNPIISYKTVSQNNLTGLLKIAEYDGSNWTTNIVASGNNSISSVLYYNSFNYNSGEDYYGLAYKLGTSALLSSGFYVTNKGGIKQDYSLGSQQISSRIPHLLFKKYKNEVRPFIFMKPNNNYFYYLENGNFVTGEFNNDLLPDEEGDMLLKA